MQHTIKTLVTTDGVSGALTHVQLGGTGKHIRINPSGCARKLCMPSFSMTLCGINHRIFKACTSSNISKQVMFHCIFEVFLTEIQVSHARTLAKLAAADCNEPYKITTAVKVNIYNHQVLDLKQELL